ncbi:MAG: sulfatase-like hydrolase/transferase [Anaerolineaceae bacterium]|nr:sulfatase-like hydrolase/transferase [Anaerolineaceae bacterium]
MASSTQAAFRPGAKRWPRKWHPACARAEDALDETGLAENTLVVFTTDHGIAFPRAKATLYDSGLNTALIVRLPGVIPAGRAGAELLSNIDLLPTVLEATGAEVPGDVQGRSFWGLFTDGPYTPRERIFAEKNTTASDCKRCVRTARYKYIRNYDEGPQLAMPIDIEESPARPGMGDDHLAPRPSVEFYDLDRDPWERNNLAGRPEIGMVENELSGTLGRFLQETDDPILRGPIARPPELPRCKKWKSSRTTGPSERSPRRTR